MNNSDILKMAIFAVGIYVFRKECGGIMCAVARTLRSNQLEIMGKVIKAL